MDNCLGCRLKEERLLKNMSGEELGKFLGVTRTAISNWENGKRLPDIVTIMTLADFFGVSIDYLMGRTMNKNSNIISFNYITNNNLTSYEVNLKKLITHLDEAGFDIPKLIEIVNNNTSNK